ncbi:aldehyde ferredoxin oxidoreductase family protein [Candidatus Chloroploca asiatica]|uniref:Aldehyde:ferredoxin oxidoreductase n=1 Tax=Candidatus Chloroploca asiatica TaxID=1506545 RepID=A0A2H3L630_9CHLR|nr:aldehyde ferredoxin oxidoreductase C-terminal domain-containing protein [Candidatus Chloroploca asiatica]PDV98683.1 aldehyde:ferredoxin oxidoreductase [Candidatus Chloroploca asiatica]
MALRTLTIDLARGHARQFLPATVERDYLGGRGAIAWLLWHHLPPATAPLAPENVLVFAAGSLAGTSAFASGGFVVGTRSPLTGAIAYSWAQGHWGAQLRRAGYDVLVIRGQATNWVYLAIEDNQVQLHSATHLLGADTVATAAMLQARHGHEATVVALGPAGEAEVAYASIVAEGRYPAEPAGTGVVMGAKRLKAIVVRGGPPLTAHDPQRMQAALDVIRRRVESSHVAAGLSEVGSSHLLTRAVEAGAFTEHNGQRGYVGEHMLTLRASLTAHPRESRGCQDCPMPCYFDLFQNPEVRRPVPELECVAGFGAWCGITDLDCLTLLADRCLRLGLDPVATSAAVSFLMECQEQGLTQQQSLVWGDGEAVLTAVENLGRKHEKRDLLSLGVGEMQGVFWGSETFAPQVKGQAMPALDVRASYLLALATATAPIGGDYRYAMTYEPFHLAPPPWIPEQSGMPHDAYGKVARLIWHERFAAILDAAGICRRLGLMGYQLSPGELLALIAGATGVVLTGADMSRLGERILTVERLFARRYADNGGLDTLPSRWLREPLEDGPAADQLPPLASMLAAYYQRHGWSPAGDPTPERLDELGIKRPTSSA